MSAWLVRGFGSSSLLAGSMPRKGPAGGVVRHGVAYSGPGEGCVCRRHDCGGVVPVSWCAEHGDAVGPVLEWYPGGGIRCTDLSAARAAAVGQTARATVD
ncbi:hypothetical protein ACGFYQ_40495 [Streptomyces sp. NPDC048258]|uniref:hypothetical protein n=1 Tax=Streptomyces sp. NPDC048258 TaxID=3365527 RepID=UPI00372335E4